MREGSFSSIGRRFRELSALDYVLRIQGKFGRVSTSVLPGLEVQPTCLALGRGRAAAVRTWRRRGAPMEGFCMSFFERLKAQASAEWRAYTEHPFANALADGTLAEAAFRTYLVQDYLFLIEFARAYALAVCCALMIRVA